MTPDYLLAAFIICVSPGIGVVHALSMSPGGGMRAGIRAGVGCTLATGFHLARLAAVLHTGALLISGLAMRWLRRAFAVSFAALGLKLAVCRA